MLTWLLTSYLLGLALANTQEQKLCYKIEGTEDIYCMAVDVDDQAEMIHYSMTESDSFGHVETLEDYKIGLAASRVESQEACYVRRLVKSFEEQVSFIASQKDVVSTVDSEVQVSAVPFDNAEEEMGSELSNFCGDLPVYKLARNEEEDSVSRRQVSITFTTCFLFCVFPKCISTTLTLPTGSTIIFGWLFG